MLNATISSGAIAWPRAQAAADPSMSVKRKVTVPLAS
jgi:hypothetical protein